LVGGDLGHLGIIFYEAAYTIVAPTGDNGPVLWVKSLAPGLEPVVIELGMAARLSAARHSWEEDVLTFCTYNTVQ
jgi:hypothetical protein